MNFIGLDIGRVRTGVAIATDGRLAMPLKIVPTSEAVVYIKSLLDEFGPSRLIVGQPRGLAGVDSQQAKFTRSQARKMARELGLSVFFVDERLSTKQARKLTGRRRVDDLSAQIILQAYLDGSR